MSPTASARPNQTALCPRTCAKSYGEPHIGTVNGHTYDFQAVGEFVLLRTADGGGEIQTRQEPYVRSAGVSINTAVAARVGDHRVAIYALGSGRLETRIDGQIRTGPDPVDLGEGQTVSFQQQDAATAVGVRFAEGSDLWVQTFGDLGLNVTLAPSETLGSTVGLAGPVVEGGLPVPALPDGTTLPGAVNRTELHDLLYVRFADAWRVTDETSLFDYADGESTATFTIPGFPEVDQLRDISLLTPEARAAAGEFCAAIEDAVMRDYCIFDVAMTGDDGFVDLYVATETLIVSGPDSFPDESPPPVGGCALLSDSEIQDITGGAVLTSDPLPATDEGGVACLWQVDSGMAGVPDTIQIEAIQNGRDDFDQYRQFLIDTGSAPIDVPNLGDAAFLGPGSALYAVSGDRYVMVQYIGGDTSGTTALARLLLD